MSIRYVDTFCGLGGFSLSVHKVDPHAQCVWAIDIDKDVSETYLENFAIDCFDDIRSVDPEAVPDHELLMGGFPCQPFSRNGKWYNKNGRVVGTSEERDNLFLSLVRIIYYKRPRYFLLENVPGILSMKSNDGKEYFSLICEELRNTGYKLWTQVLDSANYGVPQQRKRLYFVGIREDLNYDFSFPESLPRNMAIEDILDDIVPHKYYLHTLWRNRKILLSRPDKANHKFPKGHSRLDAMYSIYESALLPKSRTGNIESVAILYGDTPSGLPRQQDKIYSIKGISPTIATFSIPTVDSRRGLRVLTPRECARLQGIPDDFKLPSQDVIAYKQIGNSVSVPVVEAILKNLLRNETNQLHSPADSSTEIPAALPYSASV